MRRRKSIRTRGFPKNTYTVGPSLHGRGDLGTGFASSPIFTPNSSGSVPRASRHAPHLLRLIGLIT
eukprot:826804-Prymnesium_polylepis.1